MSNIHIPVKQDSEEVHLAMNYQLTGYSTTGGSYLETHLNYKEDMCQICLTWPMTANCNNAGCDE